MSGCLLAFLIVLGLFLVGGGVTAFLIWRSFGGFIGAGADFVAEVNKGSTAPGTKQLRSLGCEQAVVVDGKKILAVMQRFEDEMAKRENREPKKISSEGVTTYVYCKNNIGKTPTCDQVAKTYVDAVSPSEPFVANVNRLGKSECSSSYSSSGKETGAATAPDLPSSN